MLSGAANFLWPLSAMTHVVSRSKRIILLTKPGDIINVAGAHKLQHTVQKNNKGLRISKDLE